MMRIEENFLEAYDKYAPSIFRHIFFRVSDRNLAEDLTQETFFKAWRHVVGNKNREIENFKAFFYKIANNLIIDYYRRKSRMPANIDDIPEKEFAIESMERKVADDFEKDIIIRSLEEIGDEYRRIILCRYVDGLSIKEISEITGKTRGNVSVMIYRGLKMLKNLLAGRHGK